ncbi:hypothetical protein Tco_0966521 [Tanacetum coccineum]
MSQPANDDYSQHLSDDEASYHEDASENLVTYCTNKPKQQQQQSLYNNHISNISTPNSEEGGIFHGDSWTMQKNIWEAIRTGFGGNANSKEDAEAVLNNSLMHLLYQVQKGLEKGL